MSIYFEITTQSVHFILTNLSVATTSIQLDTIAILTRYSSNIQYQPQSDNMSSCGHSSTFSFLPPTLDFLAENFPSVVADRDIDRSLLRCRLCDLIETQAQADIVEAAPPGQETIENIEKEINRVKELLAGGKIKEDLTNVLPMLKEKLASAVRAADARIEEVWKAHWAVWGPGEGPDQHDDDFVDESFEELDFQIEFPVEEKVKFKSNLKVKDPAPASVEKAKQDQDKR